MPIESKTKQLTKKKKKKIKVLGEKKRRRIIFGVGVW